MSSLELCPLLQNNPNIQCCNLKITNSQSREITEVEASVRDEYKLCIHDFQNLAGSGTPILA
jgi:hypothetical protein